MGAQLQSAVPAKEHKFVALDAFRGIAAIIVVVFHIYKVGRPTLFPHGYLAVDFFFMLSGFVLTYAYQERLDAGLSTFTFLKMRLARLYPLYALGTVLGILFLLARNHIAQSGQYAPPAALVVLSVFGFLLLPLPGWFSSTSPMAFPLNIPAWSLFDEMAVNALHALLIRRCRTRILIVVAALAWVGTLASTHSSGSMNFGVYHADILSAIVRTIFGYTVGIILFRLWQSGQLRIKPPVLLPGLLLVTVFMVPATGRWDGVYDLGVTTLVMPVILLFGASSTPPQSLVVPFEKLGFASYAIYILHFPVFNFFMLGWKEIFGKSATYYAPWSGLAFVTLILTLALIVNSVYDLPARAWMNRILLSKKPRGQPR